jgi:hypothetical protein
MARIEGGPSGVSLDQLVNAFLATGGSLEELGDAIARSSRSPGARKGQGTRKNQVPDHLIGT